MSSIKTAQNEATIPINPMRLSPTKRLLKSSSVMLKTIKAMAKTTNMEVKIFIFLGSDETSGGEIK
jgi:hypothetical protein